MAGFLGELRDVLDDEAFDMNTDFTIILKRKGVAEEFTTMYTLNDLEYDMQDVVERLRELTVEEYSETKIDRDNIDPPLLFVFGKMIEKRLVYIKLKVRKSHRRHVLCVSFHYAREQMKFPYA